MAQSLTYLQLLDVLTELIDKQSSGTLYIRSECNHLITFALDAGRIYAVYHGPRRGRSAIPLVSGISGGTYHFESTQLSGTPQDLPATAEILELIRNVAGDSSASMPSPGSGRAVSEQQRKRICDELKQLLTEHLGPIADMVFEDALEEDSGFCSTPAHTRQLIDKLADDIDDNAETAQFREKASAIVHRLMGD